MTTQIGNDDTMFNENILIQAKQEYFDVLNLNRLHNIVDYRWNKLALKQE